MTERPFISSPLPKPAKAASAATVDPADALVRQTLCRLGPAMVRPHAVLTLLEADPKDVATVLEAIKRCPMLTARILGVINSAAFGMARQITSIDRAVLLLGSNRARAIAMAYGLRAMTDRAGLDSDAADSLWANSLQKAVAARKFCEVVDRRYAEEAYSLALIQDIGLPMLMGADPDYYRGPNTVMTGQAPWVDQEKKRFGIDHAAVGHGLLSEWRASRNLREAVQKHHQVPFKNLSEDLNILDVAIFLASILPHDSEEPAPGDVEWLNAIHARFLAAVYPTPEAFLRDVNQEVRQIRERDQLTVGTEKLIRKLVSQVTAGAISMTAKLCRLEQDVDQTRQGINDLRFQAFTDPLTKVLNRRGFTQLAERRIELAAEQGMGVCCMLCDLDDFKGINDTHGHDAGDLVLRGLARVMRSKLGRNDLLGRMGGDEFAILVVGVNEQQARASAQSICDAIEGKSLRIREDLQVVAHFSLGAVYSTGTRDDLSLDNLLNLADQLMYRRKHAGKHGLTFQSDAAVVSDGKLPVAPSTVVRQASREA